MKQFIFNIDQRERMEVVAGVLQSKIGSETSLDAQMMQYDLGSGFTIDSLNDSSVDADRRKSAFIWLLGHLVIAGLAMLVIGVSIIGVIVSAIIIVWGIKTGNKIDGIVEARITMVGDQEINLRMNKLQFDALNSLSATSVRDGDRLHSISSRRELTDAEFESIKLLSYKLRTKYLLTVAFLAGSSLTMAYRTIGFIADEEAYADNPVLDSTIDLSLAAAGGILVALVVYVYRCYKAKRQ